MAGNIISGSSRIVASRQQVSCKMDEDAVVLNIQDGEYYELNPVAARIWDIIQEPRAIADITAMILEEFEVGKKELEQDLHELIDDLLSRKLIEVQD